MCPSDHRPLRAAMAMFWRCCWPIAALQGFRCPTFSFGVTTTDTDVSFVSADTLTTSQPYIFLGNSFDVQNSLPLNFTSGASLVGSDITASFLNMSVGAGQTLALGRVLYNVSPTAALGPFTVTFTTQAGDNNLSQADGTNIPIEHFPDRDDHDRSSHTGTCHAAAHPGRITGSAWRKRACSEREPRLFQRCLAVSMGQAISLAPFWFYTSIAGLRPAILAASTARRAPARPLPSRVPV